MTYRTEIMIINSDSKEISEVELFLKDIFKKNYLPDKAFKNVLLCVSEAIMNSIFHGNRNNISKKVTIKVSCINRKSLIIEVRDEGHGFDYNNVDDPTSDKNIKKESGRGLFIINSICKTMEFEDDGRCIKINIDLSE